MKFILLLSGDRSTDTATAAAAAAGPEPAAAIDRFNQDLIDAGAWVEANGLQPTSEGFRIVAEDGDITLIDGPFTDLDPVLFGYWVIQVASREEALDWAGRVPLDPDGPGSGNGRVEVRRLQELEDFPVTEDESGWRERESELRIALATPAEPEPGKIRYLMMFMADQKSEAGEMPDEKVLTEMGELIGELAGSGVFISGEGLHPSSDGARVEFRGGRRHIVDGPFAEAKELVAGFTVVEVDDRDQAVDIAMRGVRINGDGRSEIRKLF